MRRRPESPTALSNLAGIGAGRVNRYGAEVIALARGAPEPVRPDGNPAVTGEPAAVTAETAR
ncbi:MAG: HRDC domain-containing protein [Planctomycetes bacterium]|nr:HRDC domain-containing protein [Planctomycetota bacterium]